MMRGRVTFWSRKGQRTLRDLWPGKASLPNLAIATFSGAPASALEMGHNDIGTEHLLLGLARGEGLAGDILEGAGLGQATLERQVTEKLAAYTEARRPEKTVSGATKRDGPNKPPRGRRDGECCGPYLLRKIFDHLDHVFSAVAEVSCALEEVPHLGEEGALFRSADHGDAAAPAEFKESFVPQDVHRS
jgi:hypothetical protein